MQLNLSQCELPCGLYVVVLDCLTQYIVQRCSVIWFSKQKPLSPWMHAGIHIKPCVHYNFGYGKDLLIWCYKCPKWILKMHLSELTHSPYPPLVGIVFFKSIHNTCSGLLAIIKSCCVFRSMVTLGNLAVWTFPNIIGNASIHAIPIKAFPTKRQWSAKYFDGPSHYAVTESLYLVLYRED